MSPELRLVAACCRWPVDREARERVAAFAPAVSDWDHVVALARAHRVEGLVWNALVATAVKLPESPQSELARSAEGVRIAAIQSIGEALRLRQRLQSAGIPFLVIKGLPVAMLAYGTATIKHSVDLDLLVRPTDVVRAAALLDGVGYKTMRPWRPLDEDEFARWSAVAKEACLVSDRGQVDLHWDLLDQPDLLAGLDPWSGTREVELLSGHGLPTMGDAAHLAYLAAHGAMSGWSRLKWIADFAAFITAHPLAEREGLCEEARRIGNSYCLDQGLILAESLIGPGLLPKAAQNPRAAQLAGLAQRLITLRTPGLVLEGTRPAARLLARMQWKLRSGARYKWLEVLRRMREQEIRFRLRMPLPGHFHWIFLPLRLVGLCFRMGHSLLRGPRTEL